LPAKDGDLANELLKDPYNFGFLTLDKKVKGKGFRKKASRKYNSIFIGTGQRICLYGKAILAKSRH
jgi:hypothetical protein